MSGLFKEKGQHAWSKLMTFETFGECCFSSPSILSCNLCHFKKSGTTNDNSLMPYLLLIEGNSSMPRLHVADSKQTINACILLLIGSSLINTLYLLLLLLLVNAFSTANSLMSFTTLQFSNFTDSSTMLPHQVKTQYLQI